MPRRGGPSSLKVFVEGSAIDAPVEINRADSPPKSAVARMCHVLRLLVSQLNAEAADIVPISMSPMTKDSPCQKWINALTPAARVSHHRWTWPNDPRRDNNQTRAARTFADTTNVEPGKSAGVNRSDVAWEPLVWPSPRWLSWNQPVCMTRTTGPQSVPSNVSVKADLRCATGDPSVAPIERAS